MQPEVDCWLQTRAVPSQKWSRTDLTLKKCLAETKASIHNPFSTLICYGSRGWAADIRTFIVGKGDGFLISRAKESLNPSTSVAESRQPMLHSVCCDDTDTHLLKAGGVSARSRRMTLWLKSMKSVLSIHMFGCWQTQTANWEVG